MDANTEEASGATRQHAQHDVTTPTERCLGSGDFEIYFLEVDLAFAFGAVGAFVVAGPLRSCGVLRAWILHSLSSEF